MINNLLNTREVISSFGKLDPESIGLDKNTNLFDPDEAIRVIEDNMHIVASIDQKSLSYKNIFYHYPYIQKICFTIFIETWSEQALESVSTSILNEELNKFMFKGEINTSITAFFLEIHNFMKQIGEDYSPKLAFKVETISGLRGRPFPRYGSGFLKGEIEFVVNA